MPPMLLALLPAIVGLFKAPGAAVTKVSEVVKSPVRNPTAVETVIGYAILAGLAIGAQKIGANAANIQAAICSAPPPAEAPMPAQTKDEL